MEEAKKDAKLQKAIRTANKKIINDAKIEARKVTLAINVIPTPLIICTFYHHSFPFLT